METTDTVKVAIGKILQIRNRLRSRLSRVESDIQAYNSTLESQTGKQVDVRKALEERTAIKQAILTLKNVLYKANAKIQSKLFELDEKKSSASFFQSLPLRDGLERHDYQNTEVVFNAIIKKAEVDATVKTLEAEIDTLQDEINVFNYSTKVDLSQIVLDLAS